MKYLVRNAAPTKLCAALVWLAVAFAMVSVAHAEAAAVSDATTSAFGDDLFVVPAGVTPADLAQKANDNAVVHLAGTETITGAKTFTVPVAVDGNIVLNSRIQLRGTVAGAGTTPFTLEIGRADNLALDANHQLSILLANPSTGIGTGLWTNTGGILNLSNGNVNTATGQLNLGLVRAATGVDSTYFTIGFGTTMGVATAGMYQLNTSFQGTGSSSRSNGILLSAMRLDVAGGSSTMPIYASGNYLVSSTAGATTRTLPTPANSYVGQVIYFVQQSGNVLTITGPTGVSVTMKTGTSIVTGIDVFTTKTAGSFTSTGTAATNSTSAMLVCHDTDGSTTATWLQLGGIGNWN